MKGKSVLVIGAGFYGLYTSVVFRNLGADVVIFEKNSNSMTRASRVNQARVHKGYHYARSPITALASYKSYTRFASDFGPAIKEDFKSYYAIARYNSFTTPDQYENYLSQLGINYSICSDSFSRILNPSMIERLYEVEEKVFDVDRLRDLMIERTVRAKVNIIHNEEVIGIEQFKDSILVKTNKGFVGEFDFVVNCTYSGINLLSESAHAKCIHRVSEMALIKVPDKIKNVSLTVMDGPFFSLMPYPSAGPGVYSLSHVRYTHHCTLKEDKIFQRLYNNPSLLNTAYSSNYKYMLNDAIRFLPILEDALYIKSIWELKTTLALSEENDSRPILFKQDENIKGYFLVLGGKIDNIYDLETEITRMFENGK
jgi:glycine/D-amino acid oxidase-like deaminating enzyme